MLGASTEPSSEPSAGPYRACVETPAVSQVFRGRASMDGTGADPLINNWALIDYFIMGI